MITLYGGIVALEVIKFSGMLDRSGKVTLFNIISIIGKYLPLHKGPLIFEFYKYFNELPVSD